jgi:hypothetical protein
MSLPEIRRAFAVLLALVFMSGGGLAQTALQKPKEIPVPDAVRAVVQGKIARTLQVDFNGDGKPDYIVIVDNQPPAGRRRKRNDKEVPDTEVWITFDLKVVKQRDRWAADYNFLWFINLDNDPVPEIISAYGYSDGSDYRVLRQRFGPGSKDEVLFYFLPVLRDQTRGGFFWGYPWDWTDIEAQKRGNHYAVRCTLNHRLKSGEDNDSPPEWQLRTPAIIFSGRTKPDARVNSSEIQETSWCDLQVLTAAIRKAPEGASSGRRPR